MVGWVFDVNIYRNEGHCYICLIHDLEIFNCLLSFISSSILINIVNFLVKYLQVDLVVYIRKPVALLVLKNLVLYPLQDLTYIQRWESWGSKSSLSTLSVLIQKKSDSTLNSNLTLVNVNFKFNSLFDK